jgi:hypothetical protein
LDPLGHGPLVIGIITPGEIPAAALQHHPSDQRDAGYPNPENAA